MLASRQDVNKPRNKFERIGNFCSFFAIPANFKAIVFAKKNGFPAPQLHGSPGRRIAYA